MFRPRRILLVLAGLVAAAVLVMVGPGLGESGPTEAESQCSGEGCAGTTPTTEAVATPDPVEPVSSEDEAAPPGEVLQLSPEENPAGLEPLDRPLSPDVQLWEDAHGHEPFGFNAPLAGEGRFGPEVEAHVGQAAGASVARLGASWATVRRSPDSWTYGDLDERYRQNVKRGLRPLWILQASPRRFTIHADSTERVASCTAGGWCSNPPRDDALGDLAVFAADLAKRYPLSAGIEVWNEPNLTHYWGNEPVDACRYSRVLNAAHDAIKDVAPRLPVLGGAMNNTHGGEGKVQIRPYLRDMLRCGAGPNMDAVSWHPYTSPNNSSLIANSQALADGFKDAGVSPTTERFVVTEMGIATESTQYNLDEEGQANWIAWQMYAYDVDYPTVPLSGRTDASIVHMALVDSTPDAWQAWAASYGLVNRDDETGVLTPRPAFCKVRTLFGGKADCPETMSP